MKTIEEIKTGIVDYNDGFKAGYVKAKQVARRVMRFKPGDLVSVNDSLGSEFHGRNGYVVQVLGAPSYVVHFPFKSWGTYERVFLGSNLEHIASVNGVCVGSVVRSNKNGHGTVIQLLVRGKVAVLFRSRAEITYVRATNLELIRV